MTSSPGPSAAAQAALLFVGGGNMARAILGGLRAAMPAWPSQNILVVEPVDALRQALAQDFGVTVTPGLDTAVIPAWLGARAALRQVWVWAVKPQVFGSAASQLAASGLQGMVHAALHVSIMAGVRSQTLVSALGAPRVVRTMPNTPALIGQGITALYARPEVDAADRAWADAVLKPTGAVLWLQDEAQLDAVTALSGSGPAYVFYVLEAMMAAGERVGLSAEHARSLALQTVRGAAELALRSSESPGELRERVTSKGGTTQAALDVLRAQGVAQAIEAAVVAARDRAVALGQG